MNISAIDTLEAIVDGDTIVPSMSFVLPTGVGTTQYYNPSTKACTPDYSKAANQIVLYPTNYSSANGKYLVPDTGTEQWYFDNPESTSAAILAVAGGSVATAWNKLFAKTTYTVNGQTFPALKVIGNLASADSLNDVKIYCKAKYNGMDVLCQGTIGIKETVGSLFDILINCVNEEGANDTVIDNDSEYLVLNADFQDAGASVAPTGSYSWKKVTASGLVTVSHVSGVTELSNSSKTLKLYDGAVEGTEEYFCCVTHNGAEYMKGIQVSDTHDPYYILIGRSTQGNLVKKGESVTYKPSVIARSTRVVQSGWSFSFRVLDNQGVTQKTASNATSFTVTGDEVHSYNGTNVHITATKS